MKISEAKAICPEFDPVKDAEGRTRCSSILSGDVCSRPSHFNCELARFKEKPPIYVSVSQVSTWQRCPRSWALQYVGKLERPTSTVMRLGVIFANCRAKIDSGLSWGIPEDIELQDRIKLEAILHRYAKEPRLCSKNEIKVEATLDVGTPFGAPVKLLGYADGLTPEGNIVEWKYTGSPDSYDRLKVYLQIGSYFLATEAKEAIVATALRPGIQMLKATPENIRKYKKDGTLYANQRERDETPEEFRVRVDEVLTEPFRYRTFLRSEFDVKGVGDTLMAAWRDMELAKRQGKFTPCFHNCDRCDWAYLCSVHAWVPCADAECPFCKNLRR